MFSDTEAIPLERAEGLLLVLNTAKGMSIMSQVHIYIYIHTYYQSRLLLKTLIAFLLNSGRGVFASSDIPAKCTIEISPVLLLTESDCHAVKTTVLDHYT